MIFVTRVEHFNAAHKLWNEKWDAEKNKEVFGKCANVNFHGHNYELHVTVKGEVSPETGFVMNAKELGDVMKAKVVDVVDHCNLNMDVPFMKGKFTSAENFAIGIWDELEDDIVQFGAHLHCVKLIETQRIYVEYYGK
ncbi:6-pyruvoyl tetrahydrobiopterin synthase [Filimonas sp.]|jgi:6-pyruvoyltetrahydropterin/6-carboxytetrahydropterin synthase|nr:6-pyruvoyl tetrahydrobiopterin synthase [Filimonas sp.]